jgi:hypothetical protein
MAIVEAKVRMTRVQAAMTDAQACHEAAQVHALGDRDSLSDEDWRALCEYQAEWWAKQLENLDES